MLLQQKNLKKRTLGRIMLASSLALCVSFAGCSQTESSSVREYEWSNENIYGYGQDAIVDQNGFYYLTNDEFLHYLDYSSGEAVLVCPNPGCRHHRSSSLAGSDDLCPAEVYSSGVSLSGFIKDDCLYAVNLDASKGTLSYRLEKSETNRSQVEAIADLNLLAIYSFGVIDNQFYYPAQSFGYEPITYEDDEGADPGSMGGSAVINSVSIIGIDLDSGSETLIAPERSGANIDYEILAVNDDLLYYYLSYFDTEFDGTNYEEAGHHQQVCSYDPKTEQTSEIFNFSGNKRVESMHPTDHGLIVFICDSIRNIVDGTEIGTYEIGLLDPETYEYTVLMELDEKPQMFSNLALIENAETGKMQYFYYDDPETFYDVRADLETNFLREAGAYFLVYSDSDPEDCLYRIYKKEDFLQGKKEWTRLKAYHEASS